MVDDPKPKKIATDLRNLPAALAPLIARKIWVLWDYEWVVNEETGKEGWAKVPKKSSGANASSNDPRTWSSYEQVMAKADEHDGIGLVVSDNIAAFDVDKCRNPENGLLHPWAEALVTKAESYTEVTISGTGIRIIGFGEGEHIHKKQQVEDGVMCESYRRIVAGSARYIVVTGVQIGSYSIVNIDGEIDSVVAELTARRASQQASASTSGTDTTESELARTIKDGGQLRHGGTRSENVWWAVNEMQRRGYCRDTIRRIISDSTNGVSDHVLSQADPRRAADRAITNAAEQLDFARDRSGKIIPTCANVCTAMFKLGIAVKHDQFTDRISVEGLPDCGPAFHDSAANRFRFIMEREWQFRPPKDMVYDVMMDASRYNSFHPVKDYFGSLRWDGTKRLDSWLVAYCGASDTEYARAVGRLTLVAAVRRVMEPGCKFDEMVVLESQQGLDKSSALRKLSICEDWYSDTLPLNADPRQVIEMIRGKWIVEVPELSGMRRADIEHVKALTSRQVDRGRLAYDRIVSDVPRQCVFFGTTNSDEYLRDLTGNRRFWPVKVTSINVTGIERDRDQLWAEAVAAEKTGCSIRLEPRLWPMAEREQRERLTIDPYLDELAANLPKIPENIVGLRIAASSVWSILGIAAGARTQDMNSRMGQAMKALGWKREKVSISGRTINGYTLANGSDDDERSRIVKVERSTSGRVEVQIADKNGNVLSQGQDM
jgi:hypothetical protein